MTTSNIGQVFDLELLSFRYKDRVIPGTRLADLLEELEARLVSAQAAGEEGLKRDVPFCGAQGGHG